MKSISGGHRLENFYQVLGGYPLQILLDQDITKETAPSLDLMDSLLREVFNQSGMLLPTIPVAMRPGWLGAFPKSTARKLRRFIVSTSLEEQRRFFLQAQVLSVDVAAEA